MKRILNILTAGVLASSVLVGVATTTLSPSIAYAASDNIETVRDGVDAVGGSNRGNGAKAFSNLLESIINLLLFVIGAVAVIMIIVGGIRYTTSAGDASQAKGARDTILYSVVGLVIAIMAYAIVNFVLKSLEK